MENKKRIILLAFLGLVLYFGFNLFSVPQVFGDDTCDAPCPSGYFCYHSDCYPEDTCHAEDCPDLDCGVHTPVCICEETCTALYCGNPVCTQWRAYCPGGDGGGGEGPPPGPTNTPGPPTQPPLPTATSTPKPTATPVPPTATPKLTATPTPTVSPTASPTSTLTPSATPTATPVPPTATPKLTATPTPTVSPTASPTSTLTPSATPTATPVPPTATPKLTATPWPSATPTLPPAEPPASCACWLLNAESNPDLANVKKGDTLTFVAEAYVNTPETAKVLNMEFVLFHQETGREVAKSGEVPAEFKENTEIGGENVDIYQSKWSYTVKDTDSTGLYRLELIINCGWKETSFATGLASKYFEILQKAADATPTPTPPPNPFWDLIRRLFGPIVNILSPEGASLKLGTFKPAAVPTLPPSGCLDLYFQVLD